tara:strand:+ start:469 stop:582 length:114 start_codon:yes stop_codon:yes gene_type:complete
MAMKPRSMKRGGTKSAAMKKITGKSKTAKKSKKKMRK